MSDTSHRDPLLASRHRSDVVSPSESFASSSGTGIGAHDTDMLAGAKSDPSSARPHSQAQARSYGPSGGQAAAPRSRRPPTGALSAPAAGAAPFGNDILEDDFDPLHDFRGPKHAQSELVSPFRLDSVRGYLNAVALLALLAALLGIFLAWPVASAVRSRSIGANTPGYNLGGINGTGQYPDVGLPTLIDKDTPQSAYSRMGYDGNEWELVYSDEFEVEGRTFFPGDDPVWEGMDIHYWGTKDYEWLDPSAVTTSDGHLVITMTQEPINDLNFKSGMIQSWNKLCFNRNAIWEVSASLPGNSVHGGFWPAFWTMGNLGRPGYGATTDGTWPYSYDSCDVGIMPNQTYANGTGPAPALEGVWSPDEPLSYLPGMRYPSCTCPGEDHPGPNNNVGRAAPEIDLIEAQVILDEQTGEVSQSFQVAPYDDVYYFRNTSDVVDIADASLSMINNYRGGPYQQAVSVVTKMPDRIYDAQTKPGVPAGSNKFGLFELEWYADFENRENGYITWGVDGKRAWTMRADALGPNPRTEIGRRIVAEEPMAMVANFHMSDGFQAVDWANLEWPAHYRIDYVRVYQREGGSLGCDPPDRPTAAFIERHKAAYNNPNLTTWDLAGQEWPKNRLKDGC